VQRSRFGEIWQDAVKTTGLPAGTRFHDLRHFYASTLIAASGLNPKEVQARLGHATASETWDTYAHLFPDEEDRGRGVFDAAFNTKSAPDVRSP
jgi:integrase